MTWLLNLIEEKPSYFVVFFSLINAFIAFNSYRVNRNNTLPKVSIIPSQKMVNDDDAYYYSSQYQNVRVNNSVYFDDFTNKYRFGKRGFPRRDFTHENHDWIISVSNKSDYPATDMIIKYHLLIQGFQYNIRDDAAINSDNIGERESISILVSDDEINIDYLAPGETKEFFITDLYGAFTDADLYLTLVKSKEKKYIKKPVKIDSYEHYRMSHLRHSSNFDYESVYLKAAAGLTDEEMYDMLSPDDYEYFLENIKQD